MPENNIDKETIEKLRKARLEFLKNRQKMSEDLEKRLFDRFKQIFYSEDGTLVSRMRYGFSCGDGWFELIWNLCNDLTNIAKELGIKFKVVQVKEKFAGLRFYTEERVPDEMNKRIRQAEKDSLKICEVCGNPGRIHSTKGWRLHSSEGWLKTLCGKHAREWDYEIVKDDSMEFKYLTRQ